ncbi:polyketide antibiotic transporter [Protofrankia sp. BMG5.30]|uniref:polyketide antibiotic transporter n=1 Tax=Protofrankia sp. BMG5.30 TaxID=1834514 RepID=UPI0020CA77A3|nr:polyketide antibiotic transporter [Protofrankia sp. BMG5.30]
MTDPTVTAPPAVPTAPRSRPGAGHGRGGGVMVPLVGRALRDARTRTVVFAYLFAVYSYVQPVGYRHTYPEAADRLAFARGFADNTGLRLLYGQPHQIQTVAGYAAWRVGGVLAIAAAVFGLLAAVRATRAEEDSGRTDLLLAGPVSRRILHTAAYTAIAAGVGALWLAEFAGLVVAGLPVAGSACLATAAASVAVTCAGIGALAGQLAASRRAALAFGGAVTGVLLLLRVLADTVAGLGWLRWLTPLGWAEQLRPLTGARPLVLLLPVVVTGVLLAVATRLARGRDIGAGLLPSRDSADPWPHLLRSTTSQALRGQGGVLTAWLGTVAIFMFVLGTVSHSISSADVPQNVQREIAKLGSGSILTPTGYLAFLFLFVTLAVSLFACVQIGVLRQDEAQHLETLLAQPVSRGGWLAGRFVPAGVAATAIALTAGLAAWAGATASGVRVALSSLLEAGANTLPTAGLFLGLGALGYALVPRAASGIAYGLVAVTFLWQLVGSLLSPPRWLLDLTPFAHVGLVPAQPFRPVAAAVMVGIGLLAGLGALASFLRRDLTTT